MWLDDPQRSAAKRAARDVRAAWRIAAWSRIDLSTLGTIALFFTVTFVCFRAMPGRAITLLELAAMALVLAVLITALLLRCAEIVRIDERGVTAIRDRGRQTPPTVHVALDQIERIEVRRWFRTRDPETGAGHGVPRWNGRAAESVSARLIDGTSVELLSRGVAWYRPVLLERIGRGWFWHPARATSGAWLVWTRQRDGDVAALMMERVLAVRAALRAAEATPVQTPYSNWGLREDLWRRLPATRAHERTDYSESLDGTDSHVVDPRPDPSPPPRPDRPRWHEPEGFAARGMGAAAPPPLPAVFWSLASQRAGAVLGRRAWMRVDGDGVHFVRRWRRDLHVQLADAERFDLVFASLIPPSSAPDGEVLPGNWRLVLLLTDGSTVPLSGLDHGSFKENRLFWAPAGGGQPRSASGSMPWPNDQPLEVAALLNASLAAAGGRAQAAEVSG